MTSWSSTPIRGGQIWSAAGATDAAWRRPTTAREHSSATDADGHLLYARALAGQGRNADAIAEYEALIKYFPGPKAMCRYGLSLQSIGRTEEARGHFRSIVKTIETSPPHVRRLNKRWYQMAKAQAA